MCGGGAAQAKLIIQKFTSDIASQQANVKFTREVSSGSCKVPHASSASDGDGSSSCWGAHLKMEASGCDAKSVIGRGHFKNKFCDMCREDGIEIAAERMHVLVSVASMQNGMTQGLWTRAPQVGLYRLINQTADCRGDPLLISASKSRRRTRL